MTEIPFGHSRWQHNQKKQKKIDKAGKGVTVL
jgi:hypothetical protein